jgi:hypothetical protein
VQIPASVGLKGVTGVVTFMGSPALPAAGVNTIAGSAAATVKVVLAKSPMGLPVSVSM